MSGEPRLSPGGQQFRGDAGSADAAVTAALDAYWEGRGSERAALIALTGARLLVPVVAILTERDEDGGEKSSEMALPTLVGHDGRLAIAAFTCVDALARWRPDARPMPVQADRVWQAAAAEGNAVVIDVAGPVPFVVDGARLAALAAGQPVPLPHEDPDVHAEVADSIEMEPSITGVRIGPGSAEQSTDLWVELLVAEPGPDWERAVRHAADEISARLAHRMSRGIQITVASLSAASAV
jgi:hypothetical protein